MHASGLNSGIFVTILQGTGAVTLRPECMPLVVVRIDGGGMNVYYTVLSNGIFMGFWRGFKIPRDQNGYSDA